MDQEQLEKLLERSLSDMRDRSRLTEQFVDKDTYKLYLTSLWTNIVLEMEDIGLVEADLEPALEIVNNHAREILGGDEPVIESFRYLTTPAGEKLMEKHNVTARHKQMLIYFASMILDPEGHRRWMASVSNPQKS